MLPSDIMKSFSPTFPIILTNRTREYLSGTETFFFLFAFYFTLSSALESDAMASDHANQVFIVVKAMSRYVSHLFEMGDDYEENPEEVSYLPEGLRTILQGCVNRYRKERYLHAFDHYVEYEDRVRNLRRSMRTAIKDMTDLLHMKFLRECTLYIMAATILKHERFVEAPDIAIDAIYRASMKSKQHEALVLWGKDEENFCNSRQLNVKVL